MLSVWIPDEIYTASLYGFNLFFFFFFRNSMPRSGYSALHGVNPNFFKKMEAILATRPTRYS